MTKKELEAAIKCDYEACIKDNVSINSWLEDIKDDEQLYEYSVDEAKAWLLLNSMAY